MVWRQRRRGVEERRCEEDEKRRARVKEGNPGVEAVEPWLSQSYRVGEKATEASGILECSSGRARCSGSGSDS